MKLWFTDLEDDTNPLNASLIEDSGKLGEVLDRHRHRFPFSVDLLCENGCYLDIGVGGPLSYVQFRHGDNQPPYMVALAPNLYRGNRDVGFMYGGTLSPIPARFILPFELAKRLAIYFQQTGGRSPEVDWEEI
jgi:hypothetical protein